VKKGSRRSVAGIAILMGSLMTACSLAVDSGRVQCSTSADCTARGAAFAGSLCVDSVCQPEPKWSCLGKPASTAPATGKYHVTFLVQHLITMMPLAGIKVRLCRKLDVACNNALSEELVSDSSGQVSFDITGGFDGYARFESDTIIPGLFFFNPPVSTDIPSIPISIGPSDVIAILALQAQAKQDPDRGVVLVSAHDCTGAVAEGVVLTSSVDDPQSIPFYSDQGLPSGSATQTDSSGYGGLLNASPGTVSFSGVVAATGKEIGEATLLVQQGAITYATVVPNGT
jgi:hypothetical protein